ncbi:hypothetical protein HDU91_003193 [Kappamyces sp. JEL0680]|nr:hypothetical protein HDU91_003193 [Kappamyces sp. JEL0680]
MLARNHSKVEQRLENFTFLSLRPHQQVLFVLAGCIAGLGVSGMHYTGIYAMRIPNVALQHNPVIVVVATVIAMVVATVGFWILFFLRGQTMRLVAAFVIGVAVCGMHYTGMMGMTYTYVEADQPNGLEFEGTSVELIISHFAFTVELALLAWSRKLFEF